MPLSKKGTQEQLLLDSLEPVWAGQQGSTDIYGPESEPSDQRLLAQAYETVHSLTAQVAGESLSWDERLLRAFQPITLTSVDLPGQRIIHITPPTPLQSRILALLGLSDSVYTDLAKSAYAIPP